MPCYNSLCRLCAGKIDGLVSFNVFSSDYEDLHKKISICLPIKITESDNFSKLVCVECAFKLDMVYEFRERCLETALLFEQMVTPDEKEETVNFLPSVNDQNQAIEETVFPKEEINEELLVDSLSRRDTVAVDVVKIEEQETVKNVNECKNDSKTNICPECGKSCPTKYRLAQHTKRHATGPKPFNCQFQDCTKSFKSKIGLEQHTASHTGIFEYFCKVCNKGFQCKSYLKVHQRVHSDDKNHKCTHCTQSFKTKQNLLDHVNRHLGVKPYLCVYCGKRFITKGLCNSHQKTHLSSDNRQYPCPICQKKFVSKSYLRTHSHIHTGNLPFICEVCGKGCLTRFDLKIHSTLHTGEKKFICETCGKAFARRDALRSHIRSHTGERPYQCKFCAQKFSQYSPMAIHIRSHTGERPYCCSASQCNKSFVSKSALSAHHKKNHQPECWLSSGIIKATLAHHSTPILLTTNTLYSQFDMIKIGFLGAGKMAQSLAKGFISSGLTKGELISASCAPQDPACADEFRALGAYAGFDNKFVIEKSQLLILAVKPKVVTSVLKEISNSFTKSHLLLSIAMGVSLQQLQKMLPSGSRVVRTMPNTPSLVGAGASVFCAGDGATPDDIQITKKLLESVGTCDQVPEDLLDVITALSGSGPAYVFLVIESLADGAVKMGLPRDLAYKLAAQTVLGAGKMVQVTKIHPAQLKDNVMSPAGSTAAGIHFLEKNNLRAAMMGAIEEATNLCKTQNEFKK